MVLAQWPGPATVMHCVVWLTDDSKFAPSSRESAVRTMLYRILNVTQHWAERV